MYSISFGLLLLLLLFFTNVTLNVLLEWDLDKVLIFGEFYASLRRIRLGTTKLDEGHQNQPFLPDGSYLPLTPPHPSTPGRVLDPLVWDRSLYFRLFSRNTPHPESQVKEHDSWFTS